MNNHDPTSRAASCSDEDRQRRYLECRGLRCPFCGDEDLEGGPVEIDGGGASQEMSCLACDRQWYDVYTLTGFVPDEA
jgi:hypothetical protein